MEARKIIITGGATRMGAAIARKLSGPNKEILIHYNKSKLKAEKLINEFSNRYNLNTINLRYFNACGADPSGDYGEDRINETHLIPNALISLIDKKNQFTIFGSNYPTKDGTCVRDYVHVMDLADAHIKALNYASENSVTEVFNLGSGAPASNKELLDTVQKHTGKKNIEMHDNRPGDPAYLVADIDKVKKVLEWEPTQSTIDNVVATAVQWYNKTHKKEIQ